VRYRADPPGALLHEPLDAFTAVFHRPSGATHLLVSPAPEILAALSGEALTIDALLARLADAYELADADRDALAERVRELVATGLVQEA
jgi:PqqD family protein of HPr-rel-A system